MTLFFAKEGGGLIFGRLRYHCTLKCTFYFCYNHTAKRKYDRQAEIQVISTAGERCKCKDADISTEGDVEAMNRNL